MFWSLELGNDRGSAKVDLTNFKHLLNEGSLMRTQ